MSGQTASDAGPQKIDVGASAEDGTLRYWLAKEGVRQGEARLAAQAAIRTALEARATAITGWAAAILLALAAAAATASDWPPRVAAGVAAALLFSAAALCIHAARPRDWGILGYAPQVIMGGKLQTELEVLKAVAEGINPANPGEQCARRTDGHISSGGRLDADLCPESWSRDLCRPAKRHLTGIGRGTPAVPVGGGNGAGLGGGIWRAMHLHNAEWARFPAEPLKGAT